MFTTRIQRQRLASLTVALITAGFLTQCGGDGERPNGDPRPTATGAPCLNSALPSPGPNEPADPWARARALLPSDVVVLRPLQLPERFDGGVLLEACVHATLGNDGPRYTVVYRRLSDGAEALAFAMGEAFGEWGNFPGPPTTEQTTVHGVAASLSITKAATNGITQTSMLVVWMEEGRRYSVRAVTAGAITKDDAIRFAQGLTPVK